MRIVAVGFSSHAWELNRVTCVVLCTVSDQKYPRCEAGKRDDPCSSPKCRMNGSERHMNGATKNLADLRSNSDAPALELLHTSFSSAFLKVFLI